MASVREMSDEELKEIRGKPKHPLFRKSCVELILRATERPEEEKELMQNFIGYDAIPTV